MTTSLFTARDLLAHVVDDADVVAGGRLADRAGLHPLVHLLKGSAQQRRLCLTVALCNIITGDYSSCDTAPSKFWFGFGTLKSPELNSAILLL